MKLMVHPSAKRDTDNCQQPWLTEARVRFLRARRQFGTQQSAADLLGVSVDAVQAWESARRKVPAWALCALEAAERIAA